MIVYFEVACSNFCKGIDYHRKVIFEIKNRKANENKISALTAFEDNPMFSQLQKRKTQTTLAKFMVGRVE